MLVRSSDAPHQGIEVDTLTFEYTDGTAARLVLQDHGSSAQRISLIDAWWVPLCACPVKGSASAFVADAGTDGIQLPQRG